MIRSRGVKNFVVILGKIRHYGVEKLSTNGISPKKIPKSQISQITEEIRKWKVEGVTAVTRSDKFYYDHVGKNFMRKYFDNKHFRSRH